MKEFKKNNLFDETKKTELALISILVQRRDHVHYDG